MLDKVLKSLKILTVLGLLCLVFFLQTDRGIKVLILNDLINCDNYFYFVFKMFKHSGYVLATRGVLFL